MLRRVSISAALAALTVPVLLTVGAPAGALTAGPDGGPSGDPLRPDPPTRVVPSGQPRAAVVSRRAKRLAAARAARAADDTPLRVTIDQLTPAAIPDKGVVRVSGSVTNDDDVVWNTINVYAFISDQPMTTAAQLDAAARTPSDAVVGRRITDRKDTIATLAPGDSAPYSFTVPRQLLRAQSLGLRGREPGVYWFGVHVLGEGPRGRDGTADGRARTFLPSVPQARTDQLPTAIVIPLRHQLIHADDGSLDDLDGWVQTLSPGGRLRSLVDFGAGSGDRAVTWVVDPALVDAVRRLAEGNPPRSLAPNLQAGEPDGEDDGPVDPSATPTDVPSQTPSPDPSPEASASPLDLDGLDPLVRAAAEAATAWLARLGEAMRPEDQVMTLPYGDVDVAGAAAHDPSIYRRAVARAGTTLPGFDVTATPVVASPSGYLSIAGIRGADPSATILLTDAMFQAPAPALAQTAGRDVVVSALGASRGGPGPEDRTGPTAMRQRLLSEAAVRFLRKNPAPLTMVVPHDWNPAGGSTFFGGLDAPWLDLTTVADAARATTPTPVESATLRYPAWQQAAELDAPGFDSAEALMRSGSSLQSLLSLNNIVAGTVADQALGTVSYSARSRPISNRASADRSRAWIAQRLGQVRVSAPRAVTLSSTSGRFQAVITNDLDQPVTVSLDAQSDDRLAVEGPRRVEVPAHGRGAALLTARTQENGIHEVTLLVTDKRGTPLGARTVLTLRSAQVSNVIWLFMGIGGALLLAAILVRLVRRVANARRRSGASGSGGSEADPADADRLPAEAGSR